MKPSGSLKLKPRVPATPAAWVAVSMCTFLAGWIGASFVAASLSRGSGLDVVDLSFQDGITIILSSLAVMITALAIIIAIVGVFGFNAIRKAAFDAGMEHAVEQFEDGGTIRELVLARVDEVITSRNFKSPPDDEWGDPEKEYGV